MSYNQSSCVHVTKGVYTELLEVFSDPYIFVILRPSFFLVRCAPKRKARVNSCQLRLTTSMHPGLPNRTQALAICRMRAATLLKLTSIPSHSWDSAILPTPSVGIFQSLPLPCATRGHPEPNAKASKPCRGMRRRCQIQHDHRRSFLLGWLRMRLDVATRGPTRPSWLAWVQKLGETARRVG